MPDLFTHYASARLPGAFLRDRKIAALLIFGTFLPDLAGKGLYLVTLAKSIFVEPTHSILGLALLCYLACLFIEERIRGKAFAALYAGSLLHVAVDLIKDNLGKGSAYPFLPFSLRGYELGWTDPENVVLLIPIDAAIVAIAVLLERRLKRVRQ